MREGNHTHDRSQARMQQWRDDGGSKCGGRKSACVCECVCVTVSCKLLTSRTSARGRSARVARRGTGRSRRMQHHRHLVDARRARFPCSSSSSSSQGDRSKGIRTGEIRLSQLSSPTPTLTPGMLGNRSLLHSLSPQMFPSKMSQQKRDAG